MLQTPLHLASPGVVVKEEDTQAWVSFAEQSSWHCQKEALLKHGQIIQIVL